MKFTIVYKVFSIPSDKKIEVDKIFSFTYEAEISQLGDLSSHINEYLQEYFTVGNYEIVSMLKADEE